jgi:uncharacterized protein YjbI with pentapeptide repeats
MTKKEWQTTTAPGRLLDYLRHRVPRHKALLCAAACIRQVGRSSRSQREQALAEAVEGYARGQAAFEQLQEALVAFGRGRKKAKPSPCPGFIEWALSFPTNSVEEFDDWQELPEQCDVIRDIVGNPFQPCAVDPRWLAWNNGAVGGLARTIDAEADFSLLPVLADALEEAGCTERAILDHCRSGGEHFRGCWVVELLLTEQPERRSLEETWKVLRKRGHDMPRDKKKQPFVPSRMPRPGDDAPLGFEFFRTVLEDDDLSSCTLPRTFFGRSLLRRVNFSNTDLSSSWLCWNDFEDCDFSGAVLYRCNMRASNFVRCRFVGARLSRADLRHSDFEGCDFTGATLTGARGDTLYGDDLLMPWLSGEQERSMRWSDDPGPEPDGG